LSDFRVSAKIDEKTFHLIEDIAAERKVSRAEALRTILTRYGCALQIQDTKLQPTQEHIAIIGATRSGKTFLARHCIIPQNEYGKRVLVLDQHNEYDHGYENIPLTYKGTVPRTTNQLFQTIQLQSIWDKTTDIIEDLTKQIESTKRKHIALHVNIANAEADTIIISAFLEQMTQREKPWKPPLLVVVEEAAKYDCKPLVSRGRHYGIQAVLISQDPLNAETMTNTKIITGANNPNITETFDPSIAFAAQQLRQGEFLWEPEKGHWARFKYKTRRRE
jgi:DNA helicase HerA-like ATPase